MTGKLLSCSVRESGGWAPLLARDKRFPSSYCFLASWGLVGPGRKWSLANPVGDQQVAMPPPVTPSRQEVDLYLEHAYHIYTQRTPNTSRDRGEVNQDQVPRQALRGSGMRQTQEQIEPVVRDRKAGAGSGTSCIFSKTAEEFPSGVPKV